MELAVELVPAPGSSLRLMAGLTSPASDVSRSLLAGLRIRVVVR